MMPEIRHFESGATRNLDDHKMDYEGFLNPEALHAYAEYMHEHRFQADGTTRDSDNWQKGIPLATYVKSLLRHVFELWRLQRGYVVVNPDTGALSTDKELACAIVFNALGFLKELVDPAEINRGSLFDIPGIDDNGNDIDYTQKMQTLGEAIVYDSTWTTSGGQPPRRAAVGEPECPAIDYKGKGFGCERQQGHSGAHMAWSQYDNNVLYPGGIWYDTAYQDEEADACDCRVRSGAVGSTPQGAALRGGLSHEGDQH